MVFVHFITMIFTPLQLSTFYIPIERLHTANPPLPQAKEEEEVGLKPSWGRMPLNQ